MNGTRIAVTGANGFIGIRLCNLLNKEGYNVISITSNPTNNTAIGEQRICNITKEKATLDVLADADIVVHLAAVSNPGECMSDFDHAYMVNVEGTRNVIKATSSKRLIFASTSHVYGEPRTNGICSESDPLFGRSPYAITKILAEMLCNNYSWNYNLNLNIVRFFNIFGESQSGKYLIPCIVNQAISEKKIIIRRMQVKRDFLYVDDAVNALLAVIRKGKPGQAYNIASGMSISISQIVKHIIDRIGDIPVQDLNIENPEPLVLMANIDRIKNIGWLQRISFEEGLDKVVKFYLMQINSVR